HYLECPPAHGPDVLWRRGAGKVWIEGVATTGGSGPDAVTPREKGHDVPSPEDHERIILRYANAIDAKRRQYESFLKRRVVSDGDSSIIAINGGEVTDDGFPKFGVPDIVKVLFGGGEPVDGLPVWDLAWPIQAAMPARESVMKKSGNAVR